MKGKLGFLAFVSLLVMGCTHYETKTETRFALHTMVGLTTYHGESTALFDDFYQELERENALVTNWLAHSYASQISRAAGEHPVLVDVPRIYALLERAVEMSRESGGRFNVLIAPLTYLWGIGTPEARRPSEEEIKDVLTLLDLDKVVFDSNMIYLSEKGMSLDLGAVGKGYLIDHMAAWLKGRGVLGAILDLGGNLYLLEGKAHNKPWTVGLREPHEGAQGYFASLQVMGNRAISTSGGYERFVEEEGKRYHHILDPATGYPVEGDLAFVTVVFPLGLEADYYSTLGLILGLEEGRSVFKEKGISGIFVTQKNEIYLVGINPDQFELLSDTYRMGDE